MIENTNSSPNRQAFEAIPNYSTQHNYYRRNPQWKAMASSGRRPRGVCLPEEDDIFTGVCERSVKYVIG